MCRVISGFQINSSSEVLVQSFCNGPILNFQAFALRATEREANEDPGVESHVKRTGMIKKQLWYLYGCSAS